MTKLKYLASLVAVIFTMTACGESEIEKMQRQQAQMQPQVVQQTAQGQPNVQSNGQVQPNVIVVQQPQQQQSSGFGDMLTGAAIGAMATHIFSNNSSARQPVPQVIERTRIVERSVPTPTPVAPAIAKPIDKPPVPATITRVDPPKVTQPAPAFQSRGFTNGGIGSTTRSSTSSFSSRGFSGGSIGRRR